MAWVEALDELLRDRAATLHDASAAQIDRHRTADRPHVDADMLEESTVLRSEHGSDDVAWDRCETHGPPQPIGLIGEVADELGLEIDPIDARSVTGRYDVAHAVAVEIQPNERRQPRGYGIGARS